MLKGDTSALEDLDDRFDIRVIVAPVSASVGRSGRVGNRNPTRFMERFLEQPGIVFYQPVG